MHYAFETKFYLDGDYVTCLACAAQLHEFAGADRRERESEMDVTIAGVGMTKFGMHLETSLRSLVAEATRVAISDAAVSVDDVELVVLGNAAAGLLTGQEMIRAQTSLSASPLVGVPTMAVENACASSSSAFHVGCMAVESGRYDTVVVVGAEKMTHTDRSRAPRALATAIDIGEFGDLDVDVRPESESAAPRSVFMEIYAAEARRYMERSGATVRDFAAVAAKNSWNGSLNPFAQTRTALSVDDVLAARMIAAPLTRPMCSSIGDGAAALVLCSGSVAHARGLAGPRVLTSVLSAGSAISTDNVVESTARSAYEHAGVDPEDLDVVEVHDAAAPAELLLSEELGLAPAGDGPALIRSGTSAIGGARPINPSGGLLARGHPIGATGAAQLVELVTQLRGRAGSRQIDAARIALAENAGGSLGNGPAACMVTILEAASRSALRAPRPARGGRRHRKSHPKL